MLSNYSLLCHSLAWSMLKCYQNFHCCVTPWHGACWSVIKAPTAVFLPGIEYLKALSKYPHPCFLVAEKAPLISSRCSGNAGHLCLLVVQAAHVAAIQVPASSARHKVRFQHPHQYLPCIHFCSCPLASEYLVYLFVNYLIPRPSELSTTSSAVPTSTSISTSLHTFLLMLCSQ